MMHAVIPVFFIEMNDDFGVAPSRKVVPSCPQLLAQLDEVVDFAVQYNPDGTVLVAHRLLARCKIDDAQTPHAQANVRVQVDALVVGTAMKNRRAHIAQLLFEDRLASQTNDSNDSAHLRQPPS